MLAHQSFETLKTISSWDYSFQLKRFQQGGQKYCLKT